MQCCLWKMHLYWSFRLSYSNQCNVYCTLKVTIGNNDNMIKVSTKGTSNIRTVIYFNLYFEWIFVCYAVSRCHRRNVVGLSETNHLTTTGMWTNYIVKDQLLFSIERSNLASLAAVLAVHLTGWSRFVMLLCSNVSDNI